jgi:hypothetical protein
MMTISFLNQISAEESNKTLLKVLNNLPEAVLLMKKGHEKVPNETM